jgi:hypothetical protein
LYVIVAAFLGFVILPLLKRLLQHLLPIVRQRCQAAITWLGQDVRGAFRWAWSFLSNQDKLSPAEALSQQVGALIIMSAAVVYGASDLLFTYATLGPLLGWEVDVSTGLFASLDRLTSLCVIALPIVFGFVITDLLQWTAMSHFAFITRGRVGMLLFAGLNFLAALAIATALGVYRWLVMHEGRSVPQAAGWMLTVPATILLPLAALLLVGLAVALTSVERFIAGVLALVVTIGGLALGLVFGVLYCIDFVVELTVELLAALPTTHPGAGAVQTGLARMHRSIGGFRTRMIDRLKTLVGEKTSPKEEAGVDEPSMIASKVSTAAPIPMQPMNGLSVQQPQPSGTNAAVMHATKS